MGIKKKLLVALILFAFIISVAQSDKNGSVDDGSNDDDDDDDQGDLSDLSQPFNRSSFPSDFVFGAATSAYQIEGGSEYRGKNIWDVFIEQNPDAIFNHSNASVAADSYHRYKDDLSLLHGLGFDAYRFSISWTRLLPNLSSSRNVSIEGVTYYQSLIDEIIFNGMQPVATIFHFDLPEALEAFYQGFLGKRIVNEFASYADLCFSLFGKKVRYWITINEPWTYASNGYAYGTFPPNRCSNTENFRNSGFKVGRFAYYNPYSKCKHGNSGTEPYIVTHHMLLAHAAAVKIYRDNYQKEQQGQIGITLVTEWFEPYNNRSQNDRDAADRSLAFMLGWYLNPLFTGTYPTEMVVYVDEDRLPKFNAEEAAMVKGSFDFIGLNYYTATYARDIPCNKSEKSYLTDPCVELTQYKNNVSIGQQTGADWLKVYPRGFDRILVHIKDKYKNPPIYVTENGVCRDDIVGGSEPHDKIGTNYHKHDRIRTDYHRNHLFNLRHAVNRKGVNVKGYFAWSLIDNFEWLDGYFVNFGTIHVDYDNNTLNRSCKDSATWFYKFLNKNPKEALDDAPICKKFPWG